MLVESFLCREWWGTGTVSSDNLGFPIPGSIKGKAGRGHRKPDTVYFNPVPDKVDGTRWSLQSLPTQATGFDSVLSCPILCSCLLSSDNVLKP